MPGNIGSFLEHLFLGYFYFIFPCYFIPDQLPSEVCPEIIEFFFYLFTCSILIYSQEPFFKELFRKREICLFQCMSLDVKHKLIIAFLLKACSYLLFDFLSELILGG